MTDTPGAPPADASMEAELQRLSTKPIEWSPNAKRLDWLRACLLVTLTVYVIGEFGVGVLGVTMAWAVNAPIEEGTWQMAVAQFAVMASAYTGYISYWLLVVAFVLCVLLVCVFTYRAVSNIIKSNPRVIDIAPHWAVATWFIPFINLWRPFQTMREIWSASKDIEKARPSPPAYFIAWWIGWLGGNITGRISDIVFRSSLDEVGELADIGAYTWAMVLMGISSALSITAAMCLLFITRGIAQAQDAQTKAAKASVAA